VVQEADQANASVQSQAQPDDSALSVDSWRDLIGAWSANRDQARRLFLNLTPASTTFSGTTFSSALTTSVTVTVGELFKSAPAPFTELQTILQRPGRFQEALEALTAFGLNVGFTGSLSATELLEVAHAALTRPSGSEVAAASVLIPARESLDALASLLRRRPKQEEAKSKVVSISDQCAKDGFDAGHFLRLDSDLAQLRKKLSEAKQQSMARWEVSVAFNEVLLFLISFLKSLDSTKMR